MRFLKQLCTIVTMMSVLVLPLGVMGCANEAPTSDSAGAGGGAADAGTESDLGEPEAGTNL